jgi:hypothetical protein
VLLVLMVQLVLPDQLVTLVLLVLRLTKLLLMTDSWEQQPSG